jgi:hypothetical protein
MPSCRICAIEFAQHWALFELVEEEIFQEIPPIQNDLLASQFQKSFAGEENAAELDRALNSFP